MIGMMTCQKLTELVTDFEEGTLSFTDRLQVRMHLMMCPHCRAYVDQLRLTTSLLSQLPPEPLDPDLKQGLIDAYRDWRESEDSQPN